MRMYLSKGCFISVPCSLEREKMDQIKLYHEDCFVVLPEIADKSIDMIFTDMPYGTTRNGWDQAVELPKLWKEYERIIKDDGVIALWAQSPFDKVLACSNLPLYRYEWVIEKTVATGFLNANRMPMKAHEQILIFYKSLPYYCPQMTHGHQRKISATECQGKGSSSYGKYYKTSYDSSDRYPRDVIKFSWDKQVSAQHPTQKPIEACIYFLLTYTKPGDVVVDNFMGSGSTGVACARTGRMFIGIEKEMKYFKMAEERIRNENLN